MTELHTAYYAALKADNEYQAELEHVYGARAGDARYNPRLNAATPRLRELRSVWAMAEAARRVGVWQEKQPTH